MADKWHHINVVNDNDRRCFNPNSKSTFHKFTSDWSKVTCRYCLSMSSDAIAERLSKFKPELPK